MARNQWEVDGQKEPLGTVLRPCRTYKDNIGECAPGGAKPRCTASVEGPDFAS